MQVKYITKYK